MCFITQLKDIVLFLNISHDFRHNWTSTMHFSLLSYQMSKMSADHIWIVDVNNLPSK